MNTMFLNDPLLGNSYLIPLIVDPAEYLKKLEDAKKAIVNGSLNIVNKLNESPIWNEILKEIEVLTPDQQSKMLEDTEYKDLQTELSSLIQQLIMIMVKPYIEGADNGKKLLNRLLTCTKRVKGSVLTQEKREMEEFKKWKESKTNKNK